MSQILPEYTGLLLGSIFLVCYLLYRILEDRKQRELIEVWKKHWQEEYPDSLIFKKKEAEK